LQVLYEYVITGHQVHIPFRSVPAFLMQNGISIMDDVELSKALKIRLRNTMSLTECTCVGKYSMREHGCMMTVEMANMKPDLKPGDVVLKLHMDTNFDVYLQDCAKFEDKLKSEILRALHLDPVCIPNAKNNIKILKVKKGSVEVVLVVFGVIVVASAIAIAVITLGGKRPVVAPRPTAQRAPATQAPTQGPATISTNLEHDVPVDVEMAPISRLRVSNHSDGSWELVGDFTPEPRCYLRDTLFQTSHHDYRTAQALKVGDMVLSSSGKILEVVEKLMHERARTDLVTLRTAQAQLTTSHDHRIVVPSASGGMSEKAAAELKKGDQAIVGCGSQILTKVLKWPASVELIELRFNPDDPVEARLLPRWAIATKGSRAHCTMQAMGPFGPYHMTEISQPLQNRSRARSCSPRIEGRDR